MKNHTYILIIREKFDWSAYKRKEDSIPCWDPSTLDYLGELPAMSASEVQEKIQLARKAQVSWGKKMKT